MLELVALQSRPGACTAQLPTPAEAGALCGDYAPAPAAMFLPSGETWTSVATRIDRVYDLIEQSCLARSFAMPVQQSSRDIVRGLLCRIAFSPCKSASDAKSIPLCAVRCALIGRFGFFAFFPFIDLLFMHIPLSLAP